ncbi:hypothetical protein [uncultured Desulfovibrio sp.]|uniref:DUF7168 domain-containing protein n=1 Tax=uncultured Desulfovibrio sp. TaxID=167968 RepID=UPI00262E11EE|nr:hypothetical protein [uncultured Desulfovibrio sp.]
MKEWAHILAIRTASVFDCQYFHAPNIGEIPFGGVGADPKVCGWMYGYLYKILSQSRKEARKSFFLGVMAVLSHRMTEQKKETPVTSYALVPVIQGLVQSAVG